MNVNYLKKTRVIVAILVFGATASMFLDINAIVPHSVFNLILSIQFIPSLLSFIKIPALCALGFLAVIILTILFGRVYCSFLCPLGILMDMIARLDKKKRKKRAYTPPHTVIRYLILSISMVTLIYGSIIVINMLDPFSNAGRILTLFIRPIFVGLNNLSAMGFEFLGFYSVAPHEFKGIPFPSFFYVLIFFIIILTMTIYRGRLYCNMVCPVGTLLGALSRISWFRVVLNETKCTGCKKCTRTCKSSCIDTITRTIDVERCVKCFNCMDVCPESAISFRHISGGVSIKQSIGTEHATRRAFFIGIFLLLLSFNKNLAFSQEPKQRKKSLIPIKKKYPVIPPGSGSMMQFMDACTGCMLCVSACPSNVLQPTLSDYGKGVLIPRLDNRFGYCNYNCNRCSHVCPTGAIQAVTLEEKRQLQLGKVKFIRDNCIVVLNGTDCGACSEHCPTKAVYMVVENKVRVPRVNTDICIGCGACEYACPAKPNKSIYVEGNPIHQTAALPKLEKPPEVDPKMEFPF